MPKRVFIIHRWEGHPKEKGLVWIKKELIKKGFEVYFPAMPNTDEPKINEWVSFLKKQVGEPDENTYFIGHSIGCQTIMRYLETIKNKKIGGVIFLAGWFNLVNLEGEEAEKIAEPWLKTKIDLKKVKSTTNNFVAIFSDNDEFVPLSDKNIFQKELGAKIIIQHNKGHFDEISEHPYVIEEIMKM